MSLRTAPPAAPTCSRSLGLLNSQGYTHAAWLNRIPMTAWLLITLIAVLSNIMVGYGTVSLHFKSPLLFALPLVVSISFFLISDIDSPGSGIIRVGSPDLLILSGSLN